MIKLEYLEKEDFKKIVQWNEGKSEEFLLQWAGPVYEFPLTEEQIEKFVSTYMHKEKECFFVYKIIDAEIGQMLGTIELDVKDTVNKVGRVGRFLIGEENGRGKGIGRAALSEVLRIGFEELKLNKITLGVFDFNHRAMRCYESVGFAKENVKENYRRIGNEYWNLYDMGITRERWKRK
jgi:RimJ/RimL family protein N-acetyltransferase